MSESREAREATLPDSNMLLSAEAFRYYVDTVAEVETTLDYTCASELLQAKADQLFCGEQLAQRAIVALPREGSDVKIVDGVSGTETPYRGPIFGYLTGYCPVVRGGASADESDPINVELGMRILSLKTYQDHNEPGTYITFPIADIDVWNLATQRHPLSAEMKEFYSAQDATLRLAEAVGAKWPHYQDAVSSLVDRTAADSPFLDSSLEIWLKENALLLVGDSWKHARTLAASNEPSLPGIYRAEYQHRYEVTLIGYDWFWGDGWYASEPRNPVLCGVFKLEDPTDAEATGSDKVMIDLREVAFGQYIENQNPLHEDHNVFAPEKDIAKRVASWLVRCSVSRIDWEIFKLNYDTQANNLNNGRPVGSLVVFEFAYEGYQKALSHDGGSLRLMAHKGKVVQGVVEGISLERKTGKHPDVHILLNVEDEPMFIAQEISHIEVPVSAIGKSQILLSHSFC